MINVSTDAGRAGSKPFTDVFGEFTVAAKEKAKGIMSVVNVLAFKDAGSVHPLRHGTQTGRRRTWLAPESTIPLLEVRKDHGCGA